MITIEPPTRWSAPADAYDAWFDRPWGHHATAIEHRLLLDAAGPISGRAALDAGCGTGRFMHRLEAEGANVIGIDRDPDALAIARNRTTGALLLGDTHQIPLPDGSVDIAFAVTVCEFAASPARVFAELARVTKPGGRVVVGSLNRTSPWGCWKRRQFSLPPWDTAHLLDRRTLTDLGTQHGRCSLRAGLYSPDALPGIERWSPALERLGRHFATRFGAFQVLTIELTPAGPNNLTRMAPR
ncbi:MAG: class I SAM-dependent methyltransferase [Actinomycetota bacterium]|nr:class I SAM-dependent methyltransferase [Actinomycetota bacterium]